ncbi:MAG: AMP-binding protein, partial [Rhizobiaceae bacterium]|nr:AMP-binding protein [Rhizobiaceae bacterium]
MSDVSTRRSGHAAEKIWLASYPECVPAEIAPLEHASLGALFESSCAKYADRLAFSSMGRGMTFRELEAQSRKIGAWLQAQGLAKGDRVAVMTPNILQNPVTVYGILRAGFVVVNVNPLYTPRELEHQLKDSGAKAIFVLENFAHTVEQVLPHLPLKHVVVATMGDMLGLKGHIVNFVVRNVKKLVPAWSIPGHRSFRQVLAEGARQNLKSVDVKGSDVAFLQYTGGTTGVSKGATLTHANLLSNKEQIMVWLEAIFAIKPRPEVMTFICALPLYHIFALTVNSLMGIAIGGHNVLIA